MNNMRRIPLILAVILFVPFSSLDAQGEPEIRIVSGDNVHHLPSQTREGTVYVPLSGIAAAFQGEIVQDDLSNSLLFLLSDNRVQLSAEGNLLSVNGAVRALSAPVGLWKGEAWVPLDFILSIVQPLYEKGILWSEEDRTFFVTRTKPLLVNVEVTFSDRGARAVLEFSRKPAYSLHPEGRRMVVRLVGSEIRIPFTRRDYEEASLRRIRFHRTSVGGEITLQSGKGFAHWNYREEKAPFRLIVEVARDSGAVLAEDLHRTGEPVRERLSPPGRGEAPKRVPVTAGRPGDKDRRWTVVIDPGHGGEETGATATSGLHEKDVVLDVALRLRRHLERDPSLAVVLTRESDRNLGLEERAALANQHHGDLFVSIHANAYGRPEAHGAETYFLSPDASDDDARRIAALENDVLGLGGGREEGNDILKLVLWDLAQVGFLAESSELAESIQDELNRLLRIENRGIKQAPFRVLTGAAMPAVLVEIGFLSNPREGKRFQDPEYKERIAGALARSILRFKRNFERRTREEESPDPVSPREGS